MGRLPRLPLTIFKRAGIAGRMSLPGDELVYCDMAAERQQRSYDIVREQNAFTDRDSVVPSGLS